MRMAPRAPQMAAHPPIRLPIEIVFDFGSTRLGGVGRYAIAAATLGSEQRAVGPAEDGLGCVVRAFECGKSDARRQMDPLPRTMGNASDAIETRTRSPTW